MDDAKHYAIKTQALSREYKIRQAKKTEAKLLIALDRIDLEIPHGELFGLLGPNGAGKTTLIKILTTLLAPTTGRAWVAGHDVVQEPHQVRPRINMVSGGESSGYGLLTVRENLWMFSQFYGIPSSVANSRITRLLEIVGLADRINTKSSDLSTGLRQKMNIVRGFLTDPEVLFLDEPTLGLDVGASRDVRAFIRRWVDERPDRTLLLTTHYMAEAEALCDRVAIINKGQVLACDSPTNLKRRLQREANFRLETSLVNRDHLANIQGLPGVQWVTHQPQDNMTVIDLSLEADQVLGAVITALGAADIRILNLQKREASLEDVFVHLVGQSMTEVERGA